MQTIIMTVGTSLLTNLDKDLQPQRPWVGQKTIGDPEQALAWMKRTDLELISADRASGTESYRASGTESFSGRPRSEVIQLQVDSSHHRPRSWVKVEKLLRDIPWVDLVRYDPHAYSAPKNSVKAANRKTEDGPCGSISTRARTPTLLSG
jgi:hypothetical protein